MGTSTCLAIGLQDGEGEEEALSDIGIALRKDKIVKVGKNGYDIRKMTNKAWNDATEEFEKTKGKIRCYIINQKTKKFINISYFGRNIITINNNIPVGYVYINNAF